MEIMRPPSYVDGYEIQDFDGTEQGMLSEFDHKHYAMANTAYQCIRMATIRTKDLGDGWAVSLLDPNAFSYEEKHFVILHKPSEPESTKKVWRTKGWQRSKGDPLQYFNPVIESKTAVSRSLTRPKTKENIMNKQELVKSMATKSGLTHDQANQALAALTETIGEAMVKGEDVTLTGFGTFKVSERAARTGRNPQTGEPIQIAATKVPTFKAGKALKDAVK